jgi:hypothetical protein
MKDAQSARQLGRTPNRLQDDLTMSMQTGMHLHALPTW